MNGKYLRETFPRQDLHFADGVDQEWSSLHGMYLLDVVLKLRAARSPKDIFKVGIAVLKDMFSAKVEKMIASDRFVVSFFALTMSRR